MLRLSSVSQQQRLRHPSWPARSITLANGEQCPSDTSGIAVLGSPPPSGSPAPRIHIERAGQLEAERLDEEVISLLLHQATTALRFFHGGTAPAPSRELTLIARLLLYANTVLAHRPSPGKALHNLRFRSTARRAAASAPRFGDERAPLSLAQRLAIVLLDVVLPYLWERLHSRLLREEGDFGARDADGEARALAAQWRRERLPTSWRRVACRAMGSAEAVTRALALANLVAFFSHGRYPTLSHRVARAGMCYADVGATRAVSFEFVNRQLVWSGFAEFLVFLTPVVYSPRVARFVRAVVGRFAPRVLGFGAAEGEAGGEGDSGEQGESRGRDGGSVRACAQCESRSPTMASLAMPCRHLYCYVCLAVAIEKDPGFTCDVCGVAVHAISRVTAA